MTAITDYRTNAIATFRVDPITTSCHWRRYFGSRRFERLFGLLLPLHLATVTVFLLALAVTPPTHGQFLLLPLSATSGQRLAADAIDRGGRLIGAGPTSGSIIVWGDRDVITKGLLGRGVLAIAAPNFLCGA